MVEPYGIAVDASGNIWVSSEATNNLILFFGLAAPTATPRLPVPVAP
jgi:streptogramin lyase